LIPFPHSFIPPGLNNKMKKKKYKLTSETPRTFDLGGERRGNNGEDYSEETCHLVKGDPGGPPPNVLGDKRAR
jgi:hypothetical protein